MVAFEEVLTVRKVRMFFCNLVKKTLIFFIGPDLGHVSIYVPKPLESLNVDIGHDLDQTHLSLPLVCFGTEKYPYFNFYFPYTGAL